MLDRQAQDTASKTDSSVPGLGITIVTEELDTPRTTDYHGDWSSESAVTEIGQTRYHLKLT